MILIILLATKSISSLVLYLLIPNLNAAAIIVSSSFIADNTCDGFGDELEQAELVENITFGKSPFSFSPEIDGIEMFRFPGCPFVGQPFNLIPSTAVNNCSCKLLRKVKILE